MVIFSTADGSTKGRKPVIPPDQAEELGAR